MGLVLGIAFDFVDVLAHLLYLWVVLSVLHGIASIEERDTIWR